MKLRKRWIFAAAVLAVGAAAFLARAPDPDAILASIDVPPSPPRTPDEARAAFRVAPGFRVELVAAEPLVVDPVAMDWDDDGRLYVVEMRGFMPDVAGRDEDRPVGRVVALEDADGDGRMDRSEVFLDGLTLPRAIAVLPEGVLVGAPPDLWLCRDTGTFSCDQKTRVGDYAAEGPNPEHLENRLLAGIDGWLYNAKSARRFKLRSGALEVGATVFRGQWGIAQDDEGRLFYNHNSGFLYGDAFPAEYVLRQPATASALVKVGVNVPLSDGEQVWGIRVAPGLNRAYMPGTLRRDGRQDAPTGVSGLAIQRGHQYGDEYVGDAFVPEAAGAAVAHFAIERDGAALRAEHRLYDDAEWDRREFLSSTDERFRPVDARVGPDGAVWILDMYRGVIQHAHYVSDYLRDYVEKHGLAPPGEYGRIWRIVREDAPLARRPPPLDTLAHQLAALDHANGWVRDRAQRRLVYEARPGAAAALRRLASFGVRGRIHALWALDGLGSLDAETWHAALADDAPAVRRTALRVGEAFFARGEGAAELDARLTDSDPGVRLQAVHSLGALPLDRRPLDVLLRSARDGDALIVQAALSGLGGLEFAALRRELARVTGEGDASVAGSWLADLAGAAHLAAQQGPDSAARVRDLLDVVDSAPSDAQRVALLAGIAAVQGRPASRRVELDAAHPLFAPARMQEADAELGVALERVRVHVTWPGDPRPGGARALTPEESARRERGAVLYAQSCANCHGADGAGNAGLAPALVASPWVRDADDWLVRIALHGLTGPLRAADTDWNATMPGHGRDPRFDDDALAGLLTHLRRSWGHAEDPIAPATVAAVRAATSARTKSWTVAELEALPVAHRLDRYVGVYKVPVVGIEMVTRRDESVLTLGRRTGPAAPLEEVGNGMFVGPDMTVRFEADASGAIESARFEYQGTSLPLSKVE